jgi:uncharacterized protein (TIGR02246 family)
MKAQLIPFMLACAVSLTGCRSDNAGPDQEAMHLVQRWATAFHESNIDAIVDLYAPDALFFGTGSKTLVTTPGQIREYFQSLNRDKPRGAQLLEHAVKVISDDVVLVTGVDRVTGVKEGNPYQADGRVSFLLEKRGTSWKIVHFHRSALPGS